ncbi:MAG: SAM-dependent methyltransferase [Betaproteobacteria bacterium]|nr:SAM-dependent methyltransferase [Betaproteobacteria bacterium]
MPASPPYLAIALLSAAALGYEILLTRLFSIIQWHHFAYMLISVALLGYGAAGTFVTVARRVLLPRFGAVFTASAALFGISAVLGFALAQRVPFSPLEILWDPRQPWLLLLVYLLLVPPFFFVATALCLTFARFGGQVHRIYSFDALGAGLGSLGILAALFLLLPSDALRLIGGLGLAAAALAGWQTGATSRRQSAALLAIALVVPPLLPAAWVQLRPSDYKDLSQALSVQGARVVLERSSPLGLLTVVDSPQVPLRHAPGLSLSAATEPPAQLGVYTDGDGPGALTRFDGATGPLAYLDQLTSALPYHLLKKPRVLVLGAGTGADVLQALYHGAPGITAVELDPQVIELVQQRYGEFSGRPYSAPGVRAHVAEARGFVAGSGERHDLIQVALLDAFSASSAGLYALSESYIYTTEALQDYLRHLAPGGILAITRWVTLPPRDTLKLFATAVRALEADGVARPGRQLALIRGWKTVTLLVKNGEFGEGDVAAIRNFCRERSFDTEYVPGIEAGEANRYNVVDQSWFFDGAQALLGAERGDFGARYKFDIEPASDDRPYFFHFFKWRTLPELLALRGQGGMPLLDWGYPVLIATLVQASAVALALILLPLAFRAREREAAAVPAALRGRAALYFLALGCGFMFIEIAFIQKFILFLSHPLYAVAVVLCAFLIFAGLGSRVSGHLPASPRTPWWPFAAIVLLALAYLVFLPPLFRALIALPDLVKIALSVALIAPLAFAMGMPFPLGLASLAAQSEALLPWAWGVNGFASVVAAILATVLAIHLGFNAVVVLALLLYVAAALAFPRRPAGRA